MKISTNEYFQKMSKYMTDQQSNIAQTQLKLAKGDALAQPSENTQLATSLLNLSSTIKRQESYISNLKLLDMKFSQTETLGIAARDQVTRIKELLIRSANGTYSDEDKKIMAFEISQIKDDLLNIVNSTDSSGNYMFSGIKNRTRPYYKDEQGLIQFQGDNTAIDIQVGPGQSMRSNSTSEDIFPSFRREGSDTVVQVFRALEDMELAVNNSDSAGIQKGMADINIIGNNLDAFIVSLGTRRNIIESRIDVSQDRILAMNKLYSNYRDLDYGKAVSTLSSQMLSLEAAQSSIAKVSQLTLFNYIK
jgi:flagellar hook-associated protein 3 FlgL